MSKSKTLILAHPSPSRIFTWPTKIQSFFHLGWQWRIILCCGHSMTNNVLAHLKKDIHQHEKDLRAFYDRTKIPDEATFYKLNELIIQIINLRFKCLDLLEEVDNVDKLIDEEWHIVLLDKIYRVLNMREWRDSVVSRLDNIHAWVEIIEDSYERFLDLKSSEDNYKVETRVRIAGYVFGILAVVGREASPQNLRLG